MTAPVNNANLIWSIANLLRGPYKPAEYGPVVLPFTVLRRLDCVLEPTKAGVLAKAASLEATGSKVPAEIVLPTVAGQSFYNTSPYDLAKLGGDPSGTRLNLIAYINGFSPNVRDIFERFGFLQEIEKLDEHELLYLVTKQFAQVDLHPDVVSNIEMGLMFEELIRKFAESSNETAGEHFTPREVIRLMVSLLFVNDDDALATGGVVRSVYDPAAGTGGMLSVSDEHLRALNPKAKLVMFGQEINPASYAICKADMVIKGQDVNNIVRGDTLTDDGHHGKTFDYCLSNPPFGVEWKKAEKKVRDEHTLQGYNGRFGPGLPRVSDGSLLFLMHLIKKMRPVSEGGGRIGIVLNGSPLFTGGAGSGESNIRQYVIENDLLDAIVALPTDMFYNTGISTYVWILDNDKPADRKGTVQLIDGTAMFRKMRKSLGSKRKELGEDDITAIVKLYGENTPDSDTSKVFRLKDFGYSTITVERPLKLNFAVIPERVELALAEKAVLKLTDPERAKLAAALGSMDTTQVWTDRPAFRKTLINAMTAQHLIAPTPVVKALVDALSERDESAEPCRDGKGKIEPDTDLRDTENVPLTADIQTYFEREVLRHVADAWIDHTKTKLGYEIPFTRHFYKYVPPRELEEIDADLNVLIGEIQALLKQVEA